MKVLFFTDAHTSRPAPEWVRRSGGIYDIIMAGGSLAKGGDQDFTPEFLNATMPTGKRVFYVQGNADSPETRAPRGVVSLSGRTEVLGDYKIGGPGGSNTIPFNTTLELSDEAVRSTLSKLGSLDILVSHRPPANTKCDRAGGTHTGPVQVRECVERERPALLLSGHAHDSRAVDKMGATTVANAGALMQGNYAEVRLDGLISVELKRGSP